MSWTTIDSAAAARRCTKRQIYRLLKLGKLASRIGDDGEKLMWLDDDKQTSLTEQPAFNTIELPAVKPSRITQNVLKKVEAMMMSISAAESITESEHQIEVDCGIAVGTQRAYKLRLRKLFSLSPRSPLSVLASHPQIRQALEYLIAGTRRSDRGALRSAKGITIVKPTGESLFLQDYLLASYAWEKHNASSSYRSLIELVERGQIVFEASGTKCTMDDMPAETTVVRWLRNQERGRLALRRARMTKSEYEAREMVYIARRPEEYRPGGKFIGDHTELDNLVCRLDGPIGTIMTGHLWVTMFIDFRTSLPMGWVLSRQPNSLTIAQTFRNSVLGTQLRVATKDGYVGIPICNAPEDVDVDRGKDYKSKYTQQVVGHAAFDAEGERCVQRISKLHYVMKHHPQSKAQQERFFGVIQLITRYLPGYKGPKYQDKPDELKTQVQNWELMTEEEFIKAFDEAVWAYSNRPRRALGGMSPIEFYLQHQQYVRRVDERVLDFLMLKSDPRKVHRGYVVVDNIEYFSLDLEGHTGKSAVLYRNPQDLGRAVIYIDGEFITVAINKEMMGKTERERLQWVKARTEREKALMNEIKALRQGMTSKEIKQLLFAGETKNVKKLELETIRKQIEQRLVITGLEGQAEEVADEVYAAKETEASQRKAKKMLRRRPVITIEAVKNI